MSVLGDIDVVRPVGLEEFVRETTPVNPSDVVSVIMELFDWPPARTVREVGLADREKLGPVTVTCMSTV